MTIYQQTSEVTTTLLVEDRGGYLVVSDPLNYRQPPAILDISSDRAYHKSNYVIESLRQLGHGLDFVDKRNIRLN